LETVSTVRGSGWVAVPKCEIAIDYEYDRFTHPLPRTVLTVSKRDVLTLRQSLQTIKMPRACPVESHVRGYIAANVNLLCECQGVSRNVS
jgi:hypothetical protein